MQGAGNCSLHLFLFEKYAVKTAVEFYSGFGYTMVERGRAICQILNLFPIYVITAMCCMMWRLELRFFLTKNGRGKYAILDMQDFDRSQATLRLMNELAKGRKSGEEKGWLTLEAVEESLGIVNE